jgi:hypothetical protein
MALAIGPSPRARRLGERARRRTLLRKRGQATSIVSRVPSLRARATVCDALRPFGRGNGHRSRRLGWRVAVPPLLLGIVFAGCSARRDAPAEARRIDLADFSRPSALTGPVIEVPAAIFEPPSVEVEEVAVEAGPVAVVERREVVEVDAPGGGVRPEVVRSSGVIAEPPSPRAGGWPVESLVGQVNGRPIFADAFFEPIEARLLRIAAMDNRAEARRGVVELVRARFEELIDSELVIAEAESGLSLEQKQGLFGWLLDLREEEIARRGGSLASAEQSVLEEQGLSLEEFMSRRRDMALASDLLRRKIEPRVIVSWREIELEYRRREAEFNPPATVRLGRIRLSERSDGRERIEEVRAKFAAGEGFAAVAASLGLADAGFWLELPWGPEGVAGLELADDLRSSLEGVEVGDAGRPIERSGSVIWLGILAVDRPPGLSLFDPMVQLSLQESLRARRFAVEQRRYLQSLRRRWVSEDIGKMRERLIAIAVDRYLP